MLNRPCNGAKKRASIHKQLEAFKKCAKSITNNGMRETDQCIFKPNESKKARLEMFGITTRVATIKANINLAKEAEIEVSKAILTMQKDYSQKNIEKVLTGEKWITSAKINTKGKPKWTASIKKIIGENLSPNYQRGKRP